MRICLAARINLWKKRHFPPYQNLSDRKGLEKGRTLLGG
jgi:hypothetical protein